MPLDPGFVADCPYGLDAIGIDEVVEIDTAAGIVRARMSTHPDLPLTRDQRAHPVRHPRHVSGGFMVHLTGMLGFMHTYYVLGLRHADEADEILDVGLITRFGVRTAGLVELSELR